MAARACGVTAQADAAALAFRAPVVIAASGGVGPPGHDDRYLDIVLGLRHLATTARRFRVTAGSSVWVTAG